MERNQEDRKGCLLGTTWCFTDAVSLSTETTLEAD